MQQGFVGRPQSLAPLTSLAQAQMGGHIVRTIGLLRAQVKIGMMNLVYNMVRLGQLLRRDRRGASAVA